MIRYFEADEKIDFKFVGGSAKLSREEKIARDKMWIEILKKSPNAFNGKVWTGIGIDETDGTWQILAQISDYKTATYKRRLDQTGGRTMGNGVLVFDRESGDLILGQRPDNGKVVSEAGKLSCFGGVIDTNKKVGRKGFLAMVTRQMKNELFEEVVIIEPSKLKYLGLAIDDKYKVEFGYVIEVKYIKIKDNDEAVRLVRIPREQIAEVVKKGNLEYSTKLHLEHWVDRIAKSQGLEFVK